MASASGRVLDERYELGEPLGRGGMGTVHRAHDHRLGRDVAIKVLDGVLAADREFLTRFQREARAAASLTHPGVVAVYDRGEQDGEHYIVMELVDGPSLGDVLRSQGPLEPERALAIAAAIAEALAAAHRIGLVHRDVKPSNVLIAPDGHPKVTDFGIARSAADTTLTTADSVLGSIPYVAPELVQGRPATPASDVYALGCVLYAMLTGAPPFHGDVAVSVLHQHVSNEPTPPSARRAEVPEELDAVVLALLAKDPGQRPADGREAADLLRVPGSGEATAILPAAVLEATRTVRTPQVETTRVIGGTTELAGEPSVAAGDGRGADRTRDHNDDLPASRWGRRALLFGLLALALVLAASLGDDTSGAPTDQAPPASPQPPTTTPPSTVDPTSPPEQEPDTIAEIIDRIGAELSASGIAPKPAKELREQLQKIAEKAAESEWGDAREAVGEARERVGKLVADGELSQARAEVLSSSLSLLAARLPHGESDGDDDGDEGDGRGGGGRGRDD